MKVVQHLLFSVLCVSTSMAVYAGELLSASTISALSVLPPEAMVHKMVMDIPQVRASVMNLDLAEQNKQKLEKGHYEWMVRAGFNQRSERIGDRFQEQELMLERPVRWFGKKGQDTAIGAKGIEVAEANHEDVWHEATRALLKDWFDAIRDQVLVRRYSDQLGVVKRLHAITEKRLKAGDASRLELLRADTEVKRVQALLDQAKQQAAQSVQVIQTAYPVLPQPQGSVLPTPQPLQQTEALWLKKILDDNHEIALAEHEAELSTLQAARIDRDRLPDPTVGVRASRERNGQERIIGFSIAIPLAGQARVTDTSAAYLKADMARKTVEQTQLRVTLTAKKVIAEYNRSYGSWNALHTMAEQSRQQAVLMMSAYKLGEATLSDALTTQNQASEAALMAELAQADALAAFARLHLDAHLIWDK